MITLTKDGLKAMVTVSEFIRPLLNSNGMLPYQAQIDETVYSVVSTLRRLGDIVGGDIQTVGADINNFLRENYKVSF